MKSESMAINIVRCFLIFLVILIHCTPFKDSYPNVQNGILAFVVPLFLFITGYLFNVGKTWKEFADYITRILIMYAVFETAYIILSYFLPVRDGVSELSLPVILEKLVLKPLGPYWYLHTMIICSGTYYLSHRLSLKVGIDRAIWVSLFLCVLMSYCSPLLGLMSPLAYFSGVITRNCGIRFCSIFKGAFVAIPIGFVTLLYGIVCNHEYASQLTYYCIILGVCTIESLVWCTKKFPSKVCRVLDYIGGNTLPVYLLHPLFTLLSKHILRGFIDNGYVISYSLTVIVFATAGSLMLGYAMDKTGISRLLFNRNMLRRL